MIRSHRLTGLFWTPNQPETKVYGTLLLNHANRRLNPYDGNTLVLKDHKSQLSKSDLTFIDGELVVGEYAEDLPIVHCKLTDGRLATLCGCEMNALRERSVSGELEGTSEKHIHGVYLGRHYRRWEDIKFRRVDAVSMSDSLSELMSGQIKINRRETRDYSFRLEYGEFSICFESRSSQFASRAYGIHITATTLCHADRFFDILCKRLLSFTTLLSGKPNYMHSFTGTGSKGKVEIVRNHPWYKGFRDDLGLREPLLQYEDLDKSFRSMLNNWITQWDELGYLYDEFFAMLYNRPVHLRQAERSAYAILEGLHKRIAGDEKNLESRLTDIFRTVWPVARKKDRKGWSKKVRKGRNDAQHGDSYHGSEYTSLRYARLMAVLHMYTLVKIGLPFDRKQEEYYLLFNKVYAWMKTLFLSSNEIASNPNRSTGYVVPTIDSINRVAYKDELAGIPIQIVYDEELARLFADLDP